MVRDNIQYVNIVIEECGVEGDIEYRPILATFSDIKAKKKRLELYNARTYDKLSKAQWEELKNKLDEYLSNLNDEEWDDDDMYQSDAELIYNFIDKEIPLDVLVKAQDIYDDQDPYYEVKIHKLRIE